MPKITKLEKPAMPAVDRKFVKGEIVVYPATSTREADYYIVTSQSADSPTGQKRYNLVRLVDGTTYLSQALDVAARLDYPIQLENTNA